ncbi:hypothetical protein RhiirA5_418299 [Rhizophagus irregularis]|uniref:Uncharacterized protein n=1 Tax=Rhizophagus irregularis TaxID=588596 RepID=A0A2N0PKN7_9GLOM|nr:hypothetical protein RhiirA5_418299 [Rhizophagus irregularis]
MGYGIWDMGYGIWDMGYGIWDWDMGLEWDLGFGIWDGMGWDGIGMGGKEYLFLGYYEEFLSWREIVDLLVSISISLVSFMVRSNITEHGGVRGLLIPVYMDQVNLFYSHRHLW